jgi:hypothetical protein
MTRDATYYHHQEGKGNLGKLMPNDYIAFGSGVNFALVALSAGLPVWKALTVAESLDPGTTGPFHLYSAANLSPLIQEVTADV